MCGCSLGKKGFHLRGAARRHVVVETGCEPVDIEDVEGADWPTIVRLSNGREYGCDMVVSATGVVPNSAADVARLTSGDIILEINRQPMYSAQEVANELTQSPPDSVCLLRIRRSGGGETLRAVRTPQKADDEA